MIELSKHIKVLLLENDCVIVPGLGGFIAHNRPALFNKADGTFFPPMRIIGFNPQLTINDGLMVQSYMQAYNTDFPDATRKIEKLVDKIKDILYQDGCVELNDLGTLYYNVKGEYEFEPVDNASFSPYLYGLSGLKIPKLNNIEKQRHIYVPEFKYEVTGKATPSTVNRTFNIFISLLRNASAVAAAILLFFILSVPVENTYVDDANYASIGSIGLFESIKNCSAATHVITSETKLAESAKDSHQKKSAVRNNVNTLKPVTVKTEHIGKEIPVASNVHSGKSSAPKSSANSQSTVKKASTQVESRSGSYIIISSLETMKDAERQLAKFHRAGYNNALILESKGRFRIAYNKYENKSEAYKKVNQLRSQDEFKNAWVFTIK